MGLAHLHADPPLLQVAHHAAGGVQPEGRAPRQQQPVEPLGMHPGVQQRGLPGGRTAAPDVHPRRRAPVK